MAAVLAVAMTALFAAVDFTLRGEINAAIFYVLTVGASGWTHSRRFLWLTTCICLVLTYAGLTFGPHPSAPLVEDLYINRSFVALALLTMAAIVDQRMETLNWLEAAREREARQNETLRDSEARARATFDQVAVGIAHTDMTGWFFQVNDRLCAISGYSRQELLQLRPHHVSRGYRGQCGRATGADCRRNPAFPNGEALPPQGRLDLLGQRYGGAGEARVRRAELSSYPGRGHFRAQARGD
jgi:PAS domain-containing protein